MDTSGHADAPPECIVMESSGRARPSVTGNASRREGHVEKERHPWSGDNVGYPVRRSAGTRDLMISQLGTRVLMSAQLGFFCAGSPPHSREIPEDPDSASKRQQWKTNDEDSTDIEEYVECPSAHWMDGSSLRITILL